MGTSLTTGIHSPLSRLGIDDTEPLHIETASVLDQASILTDTLLRSYIGAGKENVIRQVFQLACENLFRITGEELLQVMSLGCILSQFGSPKNTASSLVQALLDLATIFFSEEDANLKYASLYGYIEWHNTLQIHFANHTLDSVLKTCQTHNGIIQRRVASGQCGQIEPRAATTRDIRHPYHLQEHRVVKSRFHDWYALCYQLSQLIDLGTPDILLDQFKRWQQKTVRIPQALSYASAAIAILCQFVQERPQEPFYSWCESHPDMTFDAWLKQSEYYQYFPEYQPIDVNTLTEHTGTSLLQRLEISPQMHSSEVIDKLPEILRNTSLSPRLRLDLAQKALFSRNDPLSIHIFFEIAESCKNTSETKECGALLFAKKWALRESEPLDQQSFFTLQQKLFNVAEALGASNEMVFLLLLQMYVRQTAVACTSWQTNGYTVEDIFERISFIVGAVSECKEKIEASKAKQVLSVLSIETFHKVLWNPLFSIQLLSSPKYSNGNIKQALEKRIELLEKVSKVLEVADFKTTVLPIAIFAIIKEIRCIREDAHSKGIPQDNLGPRTYVKNQLLDFVAYLFKRINFSDQCCCYQKLSELDMSRISGRKEEWFVEKSEDDLRIRDQKTLYHTFLTAF